MPRPRNERWKPGPLDRPLAPEANRPLAEELAAIMSGGAPAPAPLGKRSRLVLAIGRNRVMVAATLLATLLAVILTAVAGAAWLLVPLALGLLVVALLLPERPRDHRD